MGQVRRVGVRQRGSNRAEERHKCHLAVMIIQEVAYARCYDYCDEAE